jgi:hypothetical protein
LCLAGASGAYHAGVVFATILGLAIVIWQRKKAKEGLLVLWPEISDQKSARKAARNGAYAAFFNAGLTGIFVILKHRYGSLVDALFFAFLGVMVYRKTSTIAAVAAVVTYVAERIDVGIYRGAGAAINALVVVIFFALLSGVRGTLAYHTRPKAPGCTVSR